MDEVEDRRWLTNVTNTRWLRCVGACLYASLEVVKRIEDAQVSVIVECKAKTIISTIFIQLTLTFLFYIVS